MNLTKIFAFGEAMIRVAGTEESPFFVAKDVCQALEIENHRDTLAKVIPEDEKGVERIYPFSNKGNKDAESVVGGQEMLVLTEAGLYRLIFRSDKPGAKAFQKWVFQEVLPAIRKTGTYGSHENWLRDAYSLARTGAVQLEILRALGVARPAPAKDTPSPTEAKEGEEFLFVDNLMAAWKAGAMPSEFFRVERTPLNHPPGAPNQGLWDSCILYLEPGKVIASLQNYLRKAGQTILLQPKQIREHLAKHASWDGGVNKRFGAPGRTVVSKAWGIKLDLHPMGYLACDDEEYEIFKQTTGAADPRKGPLYELAEAVN